MDAGTPPVGSGGITLTTPILRGATYTYRPDDLQPLTETQPAGTLTRTYETGANGTLAGRSNGYTFTGGTATWTYDNAGRFSTVTDGTDTFTYAYLANSGNLIQTVTGPAHTVTNTWETTRDVLLNKNNHPANNPANPISNFNYDIPVVQSGTSTPSGFGANQIGQRKSMVASGSASSLLPGVK